jgi:nucleoside-diphosphate-sugar epimerase
MTAERFLVTGSMGCIGAWVVRCLVQDGVAVTALDASRDDHRLKLIMTPAELDLVQQIQGDITDLDALEKVVKDQGITHVVHLAALQVPFCKANPTLGARVNVVGTVNIFETARRAGIRHVAYASSVGVYGLSEEFPDGTAPETAELRPRSLYGVFKQANEGTARVYAWDYGISSIGLRPYVVYGPGRDQGMTSGPTWAMFAAAAGRSYSISYCGRSCLNYVEDVARLFIRASRSTAGGAEVFNVRGSALEMGEIVAAIEQAAPQMAGKITFAPNHLPLPEDVEDSRLRAFFPDLEVTPVTLGVSRTVAHFRQALADGRVKPESIPG